MSQGRPLEFDPQLALQKAMEVFWCRGYEATSLQDLLTAMDISKSSFYQAFGSKHEVFERCLLLFRQRQVGQMTKALAQSPSAKDFLRSMLQSAAREAATCNSPKGCLIMNTATEFSGRDAVISGLVGEGARQFADVFQKAIERAQSAGEIDPAKNAEVLSRYIVTTISGLKTMAKAGMPATAIDDVAEVALSALV
jgi:TetR/AcrR family transcriptional regulator, transcriptional repressor for nem operon